MKIHRSTKLCSWWPPAINLHRTQSETIVLMLSMAEAQQSGIHQEIPRGINITFSEATDHEIWPVSSLPCRLPAFDGSISVFYETASLKFSFLNDLPVPACIVELSDQIPLENLVHRFPAKQPSGRPSFSSPSVRRKQSTRVWSEHLDDSIGLRHSLIALRAFPDHLGERFQLPCRESDFLFILTLCETVNCPLALCRRRSASRTRAGCFAGVRGAFTDTSATLSSWPSSRSRAAKAIARSPMLARPNCCCSEEGRPVGNASLSETTRLAFAAMSGVTGRAAMLTTSLSCCTMS